MPSHKLIKRSSRPMSATSTSGPGKQTAPTTEPYRLMRTNTFLTAQGACSRREADALIEAGRVTINGRVAMLGDRVGPQDTITKDGVVVPWGNPSVYIKFHKPIGITTT